MPTKGERSPTFQSFYPLKDTRWVKMAMWPLLPLPSPPAPLLPCPCPPAKACRCFLPTLLLPRSACFPKLVAGAVGVASASQHCLRRCSNARHGHQNRVWGVLVAAGEVLEGNRWGGRSSMGGSSPPASLPPLSFFFLPISAHSRPTPI